MRCSGWLAGTLVLVGAGSAAHAQQGTVEQRLKELEETVQDLDKELKAVKGEAKAAKPGDTKFLLTGYAFAGFTEREREPSTFSAGFNPIFLWMPTDRLLFEGEMEIGLEGNDSTFTLEYAQLSYVINDNLTVGAGRFLVPFGAFIERLHPAWINKLPDKPLAFDDGGISPEGLVGIQFRGGLPVESIRLNYAAYVANGPRLEIGDKDPASAGILFDDNFTDVKYGKTTGGRVGFLPIPELELGYSILAGTVGASHSSFSHVDTVMHGVDLGYSRDSVLLQGTVNVFAQWAWSSVGRTTYDPAGTLGFGPVTFSNRREGGYVQLSYRPSRIDVDVLKNLEAVVRYDVLDKPRGAPDAVDERRWTLGLDYWITSSMAVKTAYQFDIKNDPAGLAKNQNAVLIQFAMGF
jgi:hypothetical protein